MHMPVYIRDGLRTDHIVGGIKQINQWPRFDLRFIATGFVLVSLTFEDNATCIEVAQSDHKICPRTKHISVHLFHFCDHIKKVLITIEHVPSKYQLADIFTKPLPRDQYMRLCNQIMGWMRPSLIEGECVENILPNGRCYADVMTEMRRAVLTIPRDSPRSPFSISPQ